MTEREVAHDSFVAQLEIIVVTDCRMESLRGPRELHAEQENLQHRKKHHTQTTTTYYMYNILYTHIINFIQSTTRFDYIGRI